METKTDTKVKEIHRGQAITMATTTQCSPPTSPMPSQCHPHHALHPRYPPASTSVPTSPISSHTPNLPPHPRPRVQTWSGEKCTSDGTSLKGKRNNSQHNNPCMTQAPSGWKNVLVNSREFAKSTHSAHNPHLPHFQNSQHSEEVGGGWYGKEGRRAVSRHPVSPCLPT